VVTLQQALQLPYIWSEQIILENAEQPEEEKKKEREILQYQGKNEKNINVSHGSNFKLTRRKRKCTKYIYCTYITFYQHRTFLHMLLIKFHQSNGEIQIVKCPFQIVYKKTSMQADAT